MRVRTRFFAIAFVVGLISFEALAQRPFGFKTICPKNYVHVPYRNGYTARDFCVMKYEAKNGGSIPFSQPGGLPWTGIGRGFGAFDATGARSKCRAVGPGHDLPSNDEWQTIARNIADTGWNWSSGTAYSGTLSRGLTEATPTTPQAADANDFNACIGTTASCDGNTWDLERRTHKLSNGQVIWDLGGNVNEMVSDNLYDLNVAGNYLSTFGAGAVTTRFGAVSNCAVAGSSPYCGYGELLSPSTYMVGTIIRGGATEDADSGGIFMAILDNYYTATAAWLGFRCVYRPNRDPCVDSPPIGTVCAGGGIYAGQRNGAHYMVTPGGCTDSTTPTCSGTDSIQKNYGSSATNHQTGGVTDDGGDNTAWLRANFVNVTAAVFCADMTWGGYDDWILPASLELSMLQTNSGSLAGFATGDYLSSTQANNNNSIRYPFPGGVPVNVLKPNLAYVRCVRRY
ncbi:MAG: hypothetical protein ABL958_15555 [Bdellovibrionia bacterium]